MDLKIYQRQMWHNLKKYLDLISSKHDTVNEKDADRDCLKVLKEIILINENQKSALSALRKNKTNNAVETSSIFETNDDSEEASLFSYNEGNNEANVDTKDITEEAKGLQNQTHSEEGVDINSTNPQDSPSTFNDDKPDDNLLCLEEAEMNFNSSPENDHIEDIHDLVTSYEFMQSLGLLTIKESEAVLRNKRERHKKNAFSHIFCQSIWEKQETKRKKRDWLLSSSPPQLRRKVRPGSHPPSQQPSRPTSPLEGGSSSPPSSLSPPSPISPGSFNHNSNCEEICSFCKGKGASFQCDGCGVLFHPTCIVLSDEESYGVSEWLCSKCERMGMRTSAYSDPLRQRFCRE